MPRFSTFLAAALAIVAAGCGPTGPLVRDAPEPGGAVGYPNHSVEQVVAQVAASVAPITSVAADGDARIEREGDGQSATFSLRSRLGDSTTVVLRGPLGIEGGRGLVTADSVFVVNRLAREVLIGPLTVADEVVPGASEDGRIARAALGLLVPEADVAWSLSAADGRYQLTGRLPGAAASRSYTVDPALWRVVRVVEFGPDGRQTGVQTAEAFDTVEGAVLPRRVRIEGAGTVVELEHRRLVVNPTDLRLRFEIPDDYPVYYGR